MADLTPKSRVVYSQYSTVGSNRKWPILLAHISNRIGFNLGMAFFISPHHVLYCVQFSTTGLCRYLMADFSPAQLGLNCVQYSTIASSRKWPISSPHISSFVVCNFRQWVLSKMAQFIFIEGCPILFNSECMPKMARFRQVHFGRC